MDYKSKVKSIVASDKCLVFADGSGSGAETILEWCFSRTAKGKTLILDNNMMVSNVWKSYLDDFRKVMFYKVVDVKGIGEIFTDKTSDVILLSDHLLYRFVEEVEKKCKGNKKVPLPFSNLIIANFSSFKHMHSKKSKALYDGLINSFDIKDRLCVCCDGVTSLQVWGALKIAGKTESRYLRFKHEYFIEIDRFRNMVLREDKRDEFNKLVQDGSTHLYTKKL